MAHHDWFPPRKRLLAVALFAIVLGVAMLAVFQRSLIYFPARESPIEPQQAGLGHGRVHEIAMQSDDGLTLRGWHVLPEGSAAEDSAAVDVLLADGRPVVLYFSGNGGNRTYRDLEFSLLARTGCHVFVFDYRGYGDNPGSPSEPLLIADAHAAWRYATRQRGIDAGRMVLFGESLGGGVAVRLAADLCRSGTPPGGVVLRATFSSLADTAAELYPWLPVRLLLIEQYPSVSLIGKVTCPILHLHGTDDRVVPLRLGRRLFDAAPPRSARGVPKRFVELAGGGHNDLAVVADREFAQAMIDWLADIGLSQGNSGG